MIAAIIPAHDEAALIGRALASLRAADPPPDFLLVIADHCSDCTAQVARENGALVYERNAGQPGKGAALKWLFAKDLPGSVCVIFDADSTVRIGYFSEVQRALRSGARVVQSFVQPVGDESIAASLAAYSEVLSQVADDAVRARLGWSAPLRGTGMAFHAELLRELLPHVHTRTEDIELSLLLAERGQRVVYLPQAVVYDPKPPDLARVARQRARWLQGQSQVWGSHWPRIVRLLGGGPGACWLLGALLLKPKTLFVSLKALAFLLTLLLPTPAWVQAVVGLPLAAEVVYYAAGLWLVPPGDRARYGRALVCAPLYLWIWLCSATTALRERGAWLSTRHE